MDEMMPSERLAAWRTTLQPWLRVLRNRECSLSLMPLAAATSMAALRVWIIAPLRRPYMTLNWGKIAQGMELLELLARGDPRSAWLLLYECTFRDNRLVDESAEPLWLEDAIRQVPRFSVYLHDSEPLPAVEEALENLCELVFEDPSDSSKEYQSAKQLLLEQWSRHHDGRVFDRATDGSVQLTLSFELCLVDQNQDNEEEEDDEDRLTYDDISESVFSRIDTIAATYADRLVAPPLAAHDRSPFTIESFEINVLGDDPITSRVVHYINQIGSRGIQLSGLTISTALQAQLDPNTMGMMLQNQLKLLSCNDGDAPQRVKGIESLIIDKCQFDLDAVRVLSTAIARSQSLRELEISFDPRPFLRHTTAVRQVRWWPWLAYALFSHHTSHDIHTVSLHAGNLEILHVQAMREVLHHENPLAFLCEVETSSVAEGADGSTPATPRATQVSLSSSAAVHLGHHHIDSTGQMCEIANTSGAEPTFKFHVVRNEPEEDYIEFVVPGWGVCWTPRSEVVNVESLVLVRESHPVRHLKLDWITQQSLQATLELLRLIGASIERLTITHARIPLDDAFFTAVLTVCPKLKRIDLHASPILGFHWLADPNLHTHGTAKLETLCLVLEMDAVRDITSWAMLFDTLGDPSHPLTKSLRQLYVQFRFYKGDADVIQEETVASKCLEMLENNVVLQWCELSYCHKDIKAKYQSRFRSHHKTPLAEQAAPLSQPQRLAFLSVVTPPNDGERAAPKQPKCATNESSGCVAARFNLGTDTIQQIMDYAAVPKRRMCALD